MPLPSSYANGQTGHLADHAQIATLMASVEVRTFAGTTDTIVLADAGKLVRSTNAGAVTVTIPLNATVAYPINTLLGFCCKGAGGMTLTCPGGTIRNNTVALVQYQEVSLRLDATDEWIRCG